MTKRRSYLDVDWVELGCRGWDIDQYGAEAPYGPKDTDCMAHLDRTTLHLIIGGPAAWIMARMADLAEARVPGLERLRPWQVLAVRSDGAVLVTGSTS